jgi:hypothetical protein
MFYVLAFLFTATAGDGLMAFFVELEIDCVFVNKSDVRDGYGDVLATGRTASPGTEWMLLMKPSLGLV